MQNSCINTYINLGKSKNKKSQTKLDQIVVEWFVPLRSDDLNGLVWSNFSVKPDQTGPCAPLYMFGPNQFAPLYNLFGLIHFAPFSFMGHYSLYYH